jgi:hypothetical protein
MTDLRPPPKNYLQRVGLVLKVSFHQTRQRDRCITSHPHTDR